MSSIRLLVLGVVRILEPVHGYDVRRELLSWRLDAINTRPGSVYSALKTLEKDGHISVSGTAKRGQRPDRTEYVLTPEGRKEFEVLLRSAWWTVQQPAEPLVPALCLMSFMSRDELVAALSARTAQLQAHLDQMKFFRASIRDGATGADGDVPEHVREIMDFMLTRGRAELDWTKELSRRLKDGAYVFEDERDLGAG